MYLESYIQLNKNLATSAQACSVLSYYVIQIWMYFVAEIITRKHNMTGYYQYTKITDGVQAAACVLPRTGPNRLFSSQPAPVHVFHSVLVPQTSCPRLLSFSPVIPQPAKLVEHRAPVNSLLRRRLHDAAVYFDIVV